MLLNVWQSWDRQNDMICSRKSSKPLAATRGSCLSVSLAAGTPPGRQVYQGEWTELDNGLYDHVDVR